MPFTTLEQRHVAIEDEKTRSRIVAQFRDEVFVVTLLGAAVEVVEIEADGSGRDGHYVGIWAGTIRKYGMASRAALARAKAAGRRPGCLR
ncbi:MAG TPA: hypothetical protein VN289_10325, partial [Paraburkholderia sp.]|nr:hypothetical protein [Paraburkholderia sp.]